MRCRARAPAKVILFGEHWVVHGGRALAAAVGLYSRAYAEPADDGVVVESVNLGVREDVLHGCQVFCSLRKAFEYISSARSSGRLWPARLIIDSEIPVGAGLGSSAAVAVSASAAYACVAGLEVAPELVSRAAFESEKLVHGNPSGVDNTVSSYGGFLLYRRGETPMPLDFGGLGDVVVVVIDTGVKRSTARAVRLFTERLHRLGGLGRELLEVAEGIIDEALRALRRGDAAGLGLLMDVAHGLLNAMGVSHVELEKAVQAARASGALGAKLTGAGMGGSAIALVEREKAPRVSEKLRELGLRVYEAALGARGVSVEHG
ncbi:mevalonate kinase [Pyrodictium occultum]|uniref:mevalonate kinase n=1 Tax=Pyrodictium occultum TaxID=2309 RepID=UPI0008A959D4|nr:mevalonate kinase [Pyrodictium occultum]